MHLPKQFKKLEESNDYEVTQGTHHRHQESEPVELLPDGLQIYVAAYKVSSTYLLIE